MTAPIRILISACLVGRHVRWDGRDKRDDWVLARLGSWVEWVPVCPEAEAGLGVPREASRLMGDPEVPRQVTLSGRDVTSTLAAWTAARLEALAADPVHGFLCKSRSPSCGAGDIAVYSPAGVPQGTGDGLFVRAFRQRFPWVPVQQPDGLRDPELFREFVERVLAVARKSRD
jgi:uncharacterized protein YbbK (DUF523 family)